MSEESFNRYSIIDIATVIHDSMVGYCMIHNMESYDSYDQCIKYAMGKVMRLGRGIYNPTIIEAMCHMNKHIVEQFGGAIPL